MKPLLNSLSDSDILVSDGAMGTMLIERGLKEGECPELWNISMPDVLTEIARAYLDAGADIIQTNTFGASPLKLAQYDLADRTEEINRRAVEVVREVVGDDVYIYGSCGPSGKILKPYGDTEPDEVYASFKRQVSALMEGGVDVVGVETMTDLAEATLAIRAVKDISGNFPVIGTMTFDETPNGFYTIMGVGVEDAVSGLAEAGVDIIGSNCGNGIEVMSEIARELVEHTDLPVIIQANAGIPDMIEGRLTYPETPEFFAGEARKLIESGVSIVGGCCGTTPEHIRMLRELVDEFKRGNQRGPND